jgi:hypothetical protein
MDGAHGAPMDPQPQALGAVRPFSGDEGTPAYEWIRNITGVAALYRWSDDLCLRVARVKCSGAAALWLDSAWDQIDSWGEFRAQFMDRFGEDLDALLTRYEQCVQRRGEPTRAYRDRFLSLATRAGRADDELLPLRFFKGLGKALRRQLAPYKPTLRTIDQVVKAAQAIEDWGGLPGFDDGGRVPDRAGSPQPPRTPAASAPRRTQLPAERERWPENRAPRFPAANPDPRSQGPRAGNTPGPAGVRDRFHDRRPQAPPSGRAPSGPGVDDLTRRFGEMAINYRDEIGALTRQIERMRAELSPSREYLDTP